VRRPAFVLWLLAVLASALCMSASAARTAAAPAGDDMQLIPDPTLGVTWLADANLAATQTFDVPGINPGGSMDFQQAIDWVHAMNRAHYLGHADWQLPTTPVSQAGCQSHKGDGTFGFGCRVSPLPVLYSKTLGLTAPDTAVPIADGGVGPFVGFQPYLYWTQTLGKVNAQGYHTFSFNTGWAGSNVAKHDMYVLPMLPGNPYGIAGSGTGLFPGDGGQVVYEPSAGVTWLANADLPKAETFGVGGIDADGSMQESTAVRWVKALDRSSKTGYLGQKGWELPTDGSNCGGFGCTRDNPLGDLFYDGLGHVQGLPVDTVIGTTPPGFVNLQPYLYWSCAGATAEASCKAGAPVAGQAWSFSFGNGFLGTDLVSNDLYVMVYFPSAAMPPVKPHPSCTHHGTAITCK
jgi:hypothetical protein